jgi:hypothetical protein
MSMLRRFFVLLACTLLVPAKLTGAESPRPASRTDPPNAARISALIAQLGSSHFNEREAAARELRKIGLPARIALRKAIHSADAEVRRRARRLLSLIEDSSRSLDTLTQECRHYGMPLPEKAPLVSLVSGRATKRIVDIAFLVEPGTNTRPTRLLRGTRRFTNWDYFNQSVFVELIPIRDPGRVTPKQLKQIAEQGPLLKPIEGILFAAQCQARGWTSIAQTLYTRALKDREEWAEEIENYRRSPLVLVRHGAWMYWNEKLTEADSSWARIQPRLKTILEDDEELNTKENRALLKSLEAALVPSKAKPGSSEALIDALINLRKPQLYSQSAAIVQYDPLYLRIIEQGFDAVPALIEHWDDNRLTRYWVNNDYYAADEFERGSGDHYRVADLVHGLLCGLANDESLQTAPKAAVRSWWTKARRMVEEPYLVANALPARSFYGNMQILCVLQRKYPQGLARVYRKLLDDRPEMESDAVAWKVSGSKLPRQQKVEVYLYAAKNKNLRHRENAFAYLKEMDPPSFRRELTETLDHLPTSPRGSYIYCTESQLARFVLETEDERVRQALEKAARRADPGLRLQILQEVAAYRERPPRLKLQHAFLAAFLEDATVRDKSSNPEKFKGFVAGFDYPRLEVRNYAAMKLASLLELRVDPRLAWKPAQWADLRQQVRKALERLNTEKRRR